MNGFDRQGEGAADSENIERAPVRKNSIRLPSDRDVGTYLYCFAVLENPRSQPRLAENTSQPD
jgi:hypothetical protein